MSNENVLRSLNIYYSHNVMGKAKYQSIRKANRKSTYKEIGVPNYVPYPLLSTTINNINLHDMKPFNIWIR